MTKIAKIALSSSRDIAFNMLVLSQSNVRRIKAGVWIEELASDIVRRGLLQGPRVRAIRGADGTPTGMFEIPAGGRRFRALELLVRQNLVLAGHPSKNIATDLCISQRTVDNHRAATMRKTGSKSVTALVRTALVWRLAIAGHLCGTVCRRQLREQRHTISY